MFMHFDKLQSVGKMGHYRVRLGRMGMALDFSLTKNLFVVEYHEHAHNLPVHFQQGSLQS